MRPETYERRKKEFRERYATDKEFREAKQEKNRQYIAYMKADTYRWITYKMHRNKLKREREARKRLARLDGKQQEDVL